MRLRFSWLFTLAFALAAAPAVAQPPAFGPSTGDIRVEFTNNLSTDGFFFTPVWFAFQDGNSPSGPGNQVFDQFNVGEAADSLLPVSLGDGVAPQSPIEALAEDGLVGGLVSAFDNSGVLGNQQGVIGNANGFGGAPVIDPGETGVAFINSINPANYQFLTLASMLIPSNDVFIGNDSPEQFQVFDDNGNLIDPDGDGEVVFEIFAAANLFDAGTEEDNGVGAAFAAPGIDVGDPTTGGLITLATDADLLALVGTTTAAGTTITQADIDEIFAGGSIATIRVSVVPEPTALALLGLGMLGVVARRKRA